MAALVLTRDLVLQSQLAGAAARAGTQLAVAGTVEALLAQLAADADGLRLIILDLSLDPLDVAQLVPRIRALAPSATVLAFGPHVHHERLDAARQSGCDLVLSRGKLHAEMDALVAQYAAASNS
jgi:DNA-binding response OmpR family regulator